MAGEGNSEMGRVSHEDKELEVEEIGAATYVEEYGADYGYDANYAYGADYGYDANYAYGADYGYDANYAYGADYGYGAEYVGEYVHEEGYEAAQDVQEEGLATKAYTRRRRRRPTHVDEEMPEDSIGIPPLRYSEMPAPQNYMQEMQRQIEEEMPESLRIPPSDIQIGKQIGRGGFSTVHKAFWRGQACAAKVVQTTDVRAIQKEVAILSKLDHPHVIRCIGFSVDSTGDPSRCMILMELMDGDLRHVMNKRLAKKLWRFRSRSVPFSEAEAVNILEQIAAGMKYLHSHKVFHGDLKASNILVSHGSDGKMHVKITDFGVSQMVKRDPAENTEEFVGTKLFKGAVGTRAYQAPEVSSSSYALPALNGKFGRLRTPFTRSHQAPEYFEERYDAKNNRQSQRPLSQYFYTAKADTYCFAMTCYEILSGRVPFEDVMRKPDIPELVLQGTRPELPETVDRRLRKLIQQCWHGNASRRPSFRKIQSWLVDYSFDLVVAGRFRRKKTVTCFSLR